MSDSRAADFATWINGEASGSVDALHEDESAGNKKKRHQVRRNPAELQVLKQGQVDVRSKIQHELEAHASLISTLRTLPSNAAVEVLNRLRRGQYDGSFPWEYPVDNSEEDASGEEDEAYPDATASLPQRYTQPVSHNMQFSSSQESTQAATMPLTAMPQICQSLPNPGYYAPYMAYQTPANGQPSLSMGVPAEQLRHRQIEISQQVSQQFRIGPPADGSYITIDQRSKRTPRY
ncbi:hypothetical protein B0A48_18703 [Cryoendolithus antarcticus]|uniref:Uncharacterized protein n=1 Tax=Cryoendolithus antarcticus TaxID=1507870 RepID=A0A1V8S7Y2_9PEZI|nr:hypothetical protein B0A48_18703 [Cryoendolithus antarcticus]